MSAALDMTPPSTLEEFLDWFPYQELTYEWDGTQVIAMTGGTLRHNEVANRLFGVLRDRLSGGPCTAFRTDVAVRTASDSRVRYPDLVVTCSPFDSESYSVPDPVLIVEVLSDSTTAHDRGVKRREYAALPSLRRYVMLASDDRLALVCARDDGFVERRVRDSLALPEFGLTVSFSALYDGLLP